MTAPDDTTGRPVPQHQLPAGAVCCLTADGQPPDAETLAQIEQFKAFLKLAKETGDRAASFEAIYGEPYAQPGGVR